MKRGAAILSVGILTLAGTLLSACGDDAKESCKIAEFTTSCSNGKVIMCIGSESGSIEGEIHIADVSCEGDLIVSCDGDKIKKGVRCVDGHVQACVDGKPKLVADNVMCNGDEMFTCSATNELTKAADFCKDKSIVSCKAGELVSYDLKCKGDKVQYCSAKNQMAEKACDNGGVCSEYEKGGELIYGCFDSIEDECGQIDNKGICVDGKKTLQFCSKKTAGKLLTLNCENLQRSCEQVEANYGNDCVLKCGDNMQYSDFGHCNANTLHYCKQDGTYSMVTCIVNTCKFNGSFYDCPPIP